jgi:hypothetical protein
MAEPVAWPPRDDDALASALADLAGAVAFPSTPPLAQMVGAQLRQPRLRPRRDTGWFGWRLGRGFALALLAVLILAGAAVAFGLVIGGLRITFAPGTPPPLPPGVVHSRAFGSEIGLDGARKRAGFAILLPSSAGIGAPDHVYYNDFPTGGTVTLVWGPRPGYSADSSGVGLVITEFKAIVDASAWEKMLFGGTTATRTVVSGQTAYWVAGGPHALFYRDAGGRRIDTTLRWVGNALVWEREGLVLRVEGAANLGAAAGVARTLR